MSSAWQVQDLNQPSDDTKPRNDGGTSARLTGLSVHGTSYECGGSEDPQDPTDPWVGTHDNSSNPRGTGNRQRGTEPFSSDIPPDDITLPKFHVQSTANDGGHSHDYVGGG